VTSTDWFRELGEKHGRRDRALAVDARARVDAERQGRAACIERWPAIVAAMRSLVDSYNEGAGLDTVTVVEDLAMPGATIETASDGGRAVVVALDGSELTVRTRRGPDDPLSGPYWVSLNRTDENAAAYLLRDWLERL